VYLKMSEWKTIKSETVDVGGNNFIEVTVKQPPENEKPLIGISKGWYADKGQKRYRANILFNMDKRDEIIQTIREIYPEEKLENSLVQDEEE